MASHVDERYRREQEKFVSNHGGSSSREVVLAILPSICGVFLLVSCLTLIGKRLNRNLQTLIEFIIVIVPCVLCCTILSEFITIVCLTMLSIAIVNAALVILRKKSASNNSVRLFIAKRPFVTNFRALINVLTAICILAVDFHIFPRKFAKTEIYGYSLMDSGVGLFVIANALVAPESRNFHESGDRSFFQTMRNNSKACVKNSAPLLILGLGRFLAIEFSSYQKHVTEYGIHWNFFITLAFVKMFISTISTVIKPRFSLISGISIIALHEYALSGGGLKNWVLGDSPRNDFVSANREGLSSVPGYVGIYLIGIAIGRLIFSTYKNVAERAKLSNNDNYPMNFPFFGNKIDFECNDSMILCVKLSLITVQACAATLYCDSRYGTSRRLANAGYCFWIVTLSCAILTLLLLVEIKTDIILNALDNYENNGIRKTNDNARKKKRVGFNLDDNDEKIGIRVPEIFEAVNYNGLAFFLLANFLTGLVNMFVKTLYVDDEKALEIIVVYSAVCIFLALVLYRYKIQIKF